MRLLILAVLLVSVCVCTEAILTIKLVRKIDQMSKYFKKERFEGANRNGNGIVRDKGLNTLRIIINKNRFNYLNNLDKHTEDLKNLQFCNNQIDCQNKFSKIVNDFKKQKHL